MSKVVTSDNGLCMLLQAIHHIVPGMCQRSPAPKIFDNPSANPPSDNPTSTWPDPDSQLKSLFTLRQPNSVKANRHQAHIDSSDSETIDRQLQ